MTCGRVAANADGISTSPRPLSATVASWSGTLTSRWSSDHVTRLLKPENSSPGPLSASRRER